MTATNPIGTNTKVGSVQPKVDGGAVTPELLTALQGLITPYVGNNQEGHKIVTGINNIDNKTSLWIKHKSTTGPWMLIDNLRQTSNFAPGCLNTDISDKPNTTQVPLTNQGVDGEGFGL